MCCILILVILAIGAILIPVLITQFTWNVAFVFFLIIIIINEQYYWITRIPVILSFGCDRSFHENWIKSTQWTRFLTYLLNYINFLFLINKFLTASTSDKKPSIFNFLKFTTSLRITVKSSNKDFHYREEFALWTTKSYLWRLTNWIATNRNGYESRCFWNCKNCSSFSHNVDNNLPK